MYGRYRYNKESRKISFDGEISFYCSFYEEQGRELIARNIERQKPLRLGAKRLAFLRCEEVKEDCEDCIVETLSPITIHSTVELPGGGKRTYYYEPQELEFSEMIRQNLIRKYKAFYGYEPKDKQFELRCLPQENYKRVGIYYRRFVIKGWYGRFSIHGSAELIKMALLSGVGARNGIGCGCVRVIKNIERA